MSKWFEKIKILRKRNGWSQTDLAKRVGYSDKSMISKIEKGTVDLPRSQLLKFAEVLDTTASELIGEIDSFSVLSDDEKIILTNYRKLSHSDRSSIARILETMATTHTEPHKPLKPVANVQLVGIQNPQPIAVFNRIAKTGRRPGLAKGLKVVVVDTVAKTTPKPEGISFKAGNLVKSSTRTRKKGGDPK
jgi:transcriptional regulator with XRE-family HTH domain